MIKQEFKAKLVRIYLNEGDKRHGTPLYEAIVAKCMELGIAGATVYRGSEGFGLSAQIHHSSLWPFSQDAPVMVTIIDREEHITRLLPQLDEMLVEALIAISDVEVVSYARNSAANKSTKK